VRSAAMKRIKVMWAAVAEVSAGCGSAASCMFSIVSMF
jgi:hypothetical protein